MNRLFFSIYLLLFFIYSSYGENFDEPLRNRTKRSGRGDVNWNQYWKWDYVGHFHPRAKDFGLFEYRIINLRSGKCLDIDDSRIYQNGAKLQQWDCNGSNQQKFIRRYTGGGAFQIVNKKSGKCIDIPGWNENNGVRMWQWDCLNQNNQKWILHRNGIRSVHSSRCIDLPADESYNQGAHIQMWDCIYV